MSPMGTNARLPPRPPMRHAHLDKAGPLDAKAPKGATAPMAEHGLLPARPHSRIPAPLPSKSGSADDIDPPVGRAVQTTCVEAVANRLGSEPKREKLAPSDHAMVPSSKRPSLPTPSRMTCGSHSNIKSSGERIRPLT